MVSPLQERRRVQASVQVPVVRLAPVSVQVPVVRLVPVSVQVFRREHRLVPVSVQVCRREHRLVPVSVQVLRRVAPRAVLRAMRLGRLLRVRPPLPSTWG